MRSWYFVFPLVAAWGLFAAVDGGAADAPPGFVALFNGKDVTGWQVLPADAPDFEESALLACDLIAARDPRIGKVPGARKPAKKRAKFG